MKFETHCILFFSLSCFYSLHGNPTFFGYSYSYWCWRFWTAEMTGLMMDMFRVLSSKSCCSSLSLSSDQTGGASLWLPFLVGSETLTLKPKQTQHCGVTTASDDLLDRFNQTFHQIKTWKHTMLSSKQQFCSSWCWFHVHYNISENFSHEEVWLISYTHVLFIHPNVGHPVHCFSK